MKRVSSGTTVDEKVIIVCKEGVSGAVKEAIQKRYPKSFVKVVKADDLLKECIEFKKKVSLAVCMPEVTEYKPVIKQYWPQCATTTYDPKEKDNSLTPQVEKKAV